MSDLLVANGCPTALKRSKSPAVCTALARRPAGRRVPGRPPRSRVVFGPGGPATVRPQRRAQEFRSSQPEARGARHRSRPPPAVRVAPARRPGWRRVPGRPPRSRDIPEPAECGVRRLRDLSETRGSACAGRGQRWSSIRSGNTRCRRRCARLQARAAPSCGPSTHRPLGDHRVHRRSTRPGPTAPARQ